jgi:putative ABC transport system substrate-binding protein
MKRREFIASIGASGLTVWPVVASAQQQEQPRTIGVLLGGAEQGDLQSLLDVFANSLKELGWIEGRNLRLVIRWGGNAPQDHTRAARDLVTLRPDVMFAAPSNVVIALQRKTRTIPIVFANVSDPVAQGVVDNLARPTGNTTGFSNLEPSLMGKWLQILKEAAPGLKRVGLVIGTVNAASPIWYRMFKEVAPTLTIDALSLPVREATQIEDTIRTIAGEPHSAMIVAGDTMLSSPQVRNAIIVSAAAHRLPALYGELPFAHAGGLMSYGIDRTDPYRRAASYVNRILKGEKPSDLPVQQPTNFHFVVNLRTARAIGIELPTSLLLRADEVIE